MKGEPELSIGILAYPGCFASEVFGIVDLLAIGDVVAQAQHQPAAFHAVVMSPRRDIIAAGGVRLGVEPIRAVDVLVVPGFDFVPGDDLRARLSGLSAEIDVIRSSVAAGCASASICVGAFLLGAAGALDGRTATTAWLFADDLRQAVPAAEVIADGLVVTDGGVTTTGAFSAMYDFVLELIERHHGAGVAQRTARIALLDNARTSQAPYVDRSLLPTAGSAFASTIQRHLERHLDHPYDLARLAERFHVSTRTLLRRYKAETGETPLVHLQRARVERAQHLLRTTDRTLDAIRRSVGYRDSSAFTELFIRHTGLRPGEYRVHFQPPTPQRARLHAGSNDGHRSGVDLVARVPSPATWCALTHDC